DRGLVRGRGGPAGRGGRTGPAGAVRGRAGRGTGGVPRGGGRRLEPPGRPHGAGRAHRGVDRAAARGVPRPRTGVPRERGGGGRRRGAHRPRRTRRPRDRPRPPGGAGSRGARRVPGAGGGRGAAGGGRSAALAGRRVRDRGRRAVGCCAVKTVTTVAELRSLLDDARRQQHRIGIVPTMGYLHAGHLSLIERAAAECDTVVTSIFVNPLQFAPGEDLEAYPRDPEGDSAKAREAGTDVLFVPEEAEMFPDGRAAVRTTLHVEGQIGRAHV